MMINGLAEEAESLI